MLNQAKAKAVLKAIRKIIKLIHKYEKEIHALREALHELEVRHAKLSEPKSKD